MDSRGQNASLAASEGVRPLYRALTRRCSRAKVKWEMSAQLMSSPINDSTRCLGARYAGLWTRGAALLLDWLVFSAVFFPVTKLVKGVWIMGPSDHRWANGNIVFDPLCLYFMLVIIAYFVLLEGLAGATIGKMLVRLRVVGTDGERIGMAQSAIRNALRVVDSLPMLNLVGIVLILLSPENARFGDRVAKTRVIRA